MTQRASSFYSFSYGWTYDVFLNFRGEDTRSGFTGYLYKALCDKGINAFIDDEELRRGEEITPALLKAIEESRMAIVVFSINYASSTYCLEELVKILESIKGEGRFVCPIFFLVDPSDVRHQRGRYGEALAKYEEKFKNNKEKVQKWRLALLEAANLSGWHYQQGYEYEFIQKIVEEVSRKINRSPLHVANCPIGLESRVQKVNSLLDVGSNVGVNMVGIYGIGGVGKTTIACAVYNSIADQFEGLCFLSDIRENSMKHGLVQLQERLLLELVGEKNGKLDTVKKGIPIIKNKLHRKKVILILDDVDKLEQLQAIAGGLDWFSSGSKVIITTRNKHLLDVHGVKKIFEVHELNHEEALELFCWNAFKKKEDDLSHVDITHGAVLYCKGLPLALEIIGSNLFGKRPDEWESALDSYDEIPDKNIQEILRVSYESLEEKEKKIFLDMACFFRGCQLSYVKRILSSGRGFSAEYGIGVLIDKSLLRIDQNGFIRMHDMIEDMGKEIVRQESPTKLGERSKLWFYEDICLVLKDDLGTDNLEVIMLNLPNDKEVQWKGDELIKMRNLRILIINENARFSSWPKHFPRSLRVLKWPGYPGKYLPFDDPHNLVELDLAQSNLMLVKPLTNFKSLSRLVLRSCQFLEEVPDLTGAPNLKKLNLKGCKNLVEVHDSVGLLEKLEWLTAEGCIKLRILPRCFKLTSLKALNLSSCWSLQSFPEILGEMENIKRIKLWNSGIEDLPFSFGNLIGLEFLELDKCCRLYGLPISVFKLPKLKRLKAGNCDGFGSRLGKCQEQEMVGLLMSSNLRCVELPYSNLTDELLATYLPCFLNLEELNLAATEITILPADISRCQLLRILCLDNCKQLREIRGIPPNIRHISAANCTSLTCQAQSILLSQEIHEAGNTWFMLPGSRIPEWIDHMTRGRFLSFWFRNNFPTIAVCSIFTPCGECGIFNSLMYHMLINGIPQNISWHPNSLEFQTDHIFLSDLRVSFHSGELQRLYIEDGWNYVEISHPNYINTSFTTFITKWMGVHVYKQQMSMHDIRFTNPNPNPPYTTTINNVFGVFNRDLDLNNIPSQQNYPASQGMEICEAPNLKRHSCWKSEQEARSIRPKKTCDDFWFEKNHKGKETSIYIEMYEPGCDYGFLETQQQIGSDYDHVSQSLWEAISKIEAPGKVKNLLWCICKKNLPTYEYLFRRKLVNNPLCPICEIEPETVERVFLFCPWTQPLWFASGFQWNVNVNSVQSFQAWICQKLEEIPRVHPNANKISCHVGNICWAIWKARNEFVLDCQPKDPWRAFTNLS